MKLRFVWTALLAAALSLTGCVPAESASGAAEPDLEQLTEEYLAPIAISGIGSQSWKDPGELDPDKLLDYYVVWAMPKERDPEQPETILAEELEEKLRERFDVPAELLRQADCYDPETGVYTPGYVGSSAGFRVTSARESAGHLFLEYEYYSPADDTTVIRFGLLLMEPCSEGYRYLSCDTEPLPPEVLPPAGEAEKAGQ